MNLSIQQYITRHSNHLTMPIPAQTWQEWKHLAEGNLQITEHLPISHRSTFGDGIWDFYDPTNIRNLGKSASLYQISWQAYEGVLPQEIIHSVKVLGVFLVHYPTTLHIFRKAQRQGLVPATYCKYLADLLRFLKELCSQSKLAAGCLQTLSDFTVEDIARTLATRQFDRIWPRHICKLFQAFTNPLIRPYLPSGKDLSWTEHDLATLECNPYSGAQQGKKEVYRDKPLPDALLNLLVQVATEDVLLFLAQLRRSPVTSIPNIPSAKKKWLIHRPDFEQVYSAFVTVTNARYDARRKTGKSTNITRLWEEYKQKFAVSYREVRVAITRLLMAARYLLLQFTGLRYSEAVQLQIGCVQTLASGEHVIKATVIKGRTMNLLRDVDYWLACPIVRDAVSVLEELTPLTQSPYLFASNDYVAARKKLSPVTNERFRDFLNAYLYDIDEQQKFCKPVSNYAFRCKGVLPPYWLGTHRLRHTLSLQMCRADLGIPFISFHLKHVYHGYKRLESVQDVTLGYGGIGDELFNNATSRRQAHREKVQALYHPDAPVTGPGAKEFKENRKVYFTGMMAAGWQLDEIMEQLVNQGMLLADVGLGYCQGRREIQQDDGSRTPPPCLGQLKCNPNHCKNAIIPPSKIPIWTQVYKENKRHLQDPLLAHARTEYQYFMEEAQQVLFQLGVKVEEL